MRLVDRAATSLVGKVDDSSCNDGISAYIDFSDTRTLTYMASYDEFNFSDLVGQTCTAVLEIGGELFFHLKDGRVAKLFHKQDCCESVYLDDTCGELTDLVGSPIIQAEENSSSDNPAGVPVPDYQDSFTWTFYRIATAKGQVVLRWYGSSNEYYSEEVNFEIYKPQ